MQQAQDRLDHRRLAGPVRPDDRHQHALRHDHVDVPEHRAVAVGHGHIGDLDSRRGWTHDRASFPRSALTIVVTLARIMPG